MKALQQEVAKKKDVVRAKDGNGWTVRTCFCVIGVESCDLLIFTVCLFFSSKFQPLHEGARGGHVEVVKYLIDNGADVNDRAGKSGGTALWWAKRELGSDHPVIEFLENLGAVEIGPDL
jgi:hypothetical protein